MNHPLQYCSQEETVTFSQDSDYPEISGYGETTPIKIYSTNPDDPLNSVVIKIGDSVFLPSQIKKILDTHTTFLKAIKTFHNTEKN